MNKQITLNRIPAGKIAALERRLKPLTYKARDADEIALGILKGMRFTGSAVPAEAARKFLEIELNAVKAEAILGLNEFKKLKKD